MKCITASSRHVVLWSYSPIHKVSGHEIAKSRCFTPEFGDLGTSIIRILYKLASTPARQPLTNGNNREADYGSQSAVFFFQEVGRSADCDPIRAVHCTGEVIPSVNSRLRVTYCMLECRICRCVLDRHA